MRLTQDGLLSGEKWMVGLGGRCEAVYVLARTGDRGPGAFSALLLDLTDVPGEHFTMVPAPRTGGLRGIDLATMRFTGSPRLRRRSSAGGERAWKWPSRPSRWCG